MAVKTITITENAYKALKSMKDTGESFSKTILRISKRKPLSGFFGAVGNESGMNLEKAVFEIRKRRNKSHRARVAGIVHSVHEA